MADPGDETKGTGFGTLPKRVVRTGVALVHENEIVYPAAGSEAQVREVLNDPSNNVALHFPVIIEVYGEEKSSTDEVNEDVVMNAIDRAFRLA